MVDISIVDEGYKLTYNWGVPHCIIILIQAAASSCPFCAARHSAVAPFASPFSSAVEEKSSGSSGRWPLPAARCKGNTSSPRIPGSPVHPTRPWENHGKTMGKLLAKPWENLFWDFYGPKNHGKTLGFNYWTVMGKPWIFWKIILSWLWLFPFTIWLFNIAMENHHF